MKGKSTAPIHNPSPLTQLVPFAHNFPLKKYQVDTISLCILEIPEIMTSLEFCPFKYTYNKWETHAYQSYLKLSLF